MGWLRARAPKRISVWAAACVLGCCTLCAAGSVRAQRTSSLSWVRLPGAEDCVSTQALAARVEQRIGRAAFVSASQADLSLEGRVERVTDPASFVATLVVSDREGNMLGQRVLRAPGDDCSALDPSLVLVIAIAIDPDATLPSDQSKADPALSDETQALLSQLQLPKLSDQALLQELAVPDPNARSVEDAIGRREPPSRPAGSTQPGAGHGPDRPTGGEAAAVRLTLAAGVSGELGVLPALGVGGELRIGLEPRGPLAIELMLGGLLAKEHALAEQAGRGDFSLLAAALVACMPFNPKSALVLRACAGARAGSLRASGSGFAQHYATSSAWLEPLASLGARYHFSPLGRFFVQAHAALGIPTIRDRFAYEDDSGMRQTLHRPSAITGHAELGVGTRF